MPFIEMCLSKSNPDHPLGKVKLAMQMSPESVFEDLQFKQTQCCGIFIMTLPRLERVLKLVESMTGFRIEFTQTNRSQLQKLIAKIVEEDIGMRVEWPENSCRRPSETNCQCGKPMACSPRL